jgi:integrase
MRGQGRVYRPVVRGKPIAVFWLDYSLRGERHRESSGMTSKTEALRLLRTRIGDRESGKVIARPDRVMLAEYVKGEDGTLTLVGGLRWLHEKHYDREGLRSKDRIQQCWNQIERFFPTPTPVTAITPTRLGAYAEARLTDGAARQTINTELSTLRRAFNLAIENEDLATAPTIKLAKVENARDGFFEDDDFATVLLELPAYLQPVIRLLRVTGWRVMEALGLTWDRVDWEGQGIRLSARQTKGKRARLFPFGLAPDLKAVLDAAWATRDGLFVFQREGKAIGYTTLLHQWQRATQRAGCVGRIIHDLRRTAARDFRRAGVDEGTIMALCGWRTRSMFDRYNIIDETDLADAVAKRFSNGKQRQTTEGTAAPAGPLSSTAV